MDQVRVEKEKFEARLKKATDSSDRTDEQIAKVPSKTAETYK